MKIINTDWQLLNSLKTYKKEIMKYYLLIIAFSICSLAFGQTNMYKYKVSDIPWPEKFGNHRAVIHVTKPANAVLLNFQWRRSDANVAERMFLIVNAETGDTIKNIQRINVNNDICNIKFGPVTKKGRYYFYYLPYIVQTGHGFYGRNYYPKENVPNVTWLKSLSKKIPVAKIVEIQSRTAFDIVNIHYKVLTNKYQLK